MNIGSHVSTGMPAGLAFLDDRLAHLDKLVVDIVEAFRVFLEHWLNRLPAEVTSNERDRILKDCADKFVAILPYIEIYGKVLRYHLYSEGLKDYGKVLIQINLHC